MKIIKEYELDYYFNAHGYVYTFFMSRNGTLYYGKDLTNKNFHDMVRFLNPSFYREDINLILEKAIKLKKFTRFTISIGE